MCDKCVKAYANCLITLAAVPIRISTPKHVVDFGKVSLDLNIDPFEPKAELSLFITVEDCQLVESESISIKYCPFCGELLSDVIKKLEEVENNQT